MRRLPPATISRLAATEPVQACCSLCSRIGLSSEATTSEEPDVIDVFPRDGSGRHASGRYRKDDQTPAIIFSLPGNQQKLITLESNIAKNMVRHHGRQGLLAQRYHLRLEHEQFPVLPRVVHINSVSNLVENITFMHCPPGRRVVVPVPVKVIGEDACPGIKQNGFPYLIRRYVECLCPGDNIPPYIEVDISRLKLGQTVLPLQLKLPEGIKLVAQHHTLPVCKIAGKSSRSEG